MPPPVAIAARQKLGSGLDEGTSFGPIQNRDQFERVCELVEDYAAGARILCGGRAAARQGLLYPPTIVADIADGTRLVDEEQFGPVLPVIPLPRRGRGAAARQRQHQRSQRLGVVGRPGGRARAGEPPECGTVWINGHAEVLPHCPFGGCKMSGFGVEFGLEGLLEYTRPRSSTSTSPPPECPQPLGFLAPPVRAGKRERALRARRRRPSLAAPPASGVAIAVAMVRPRTLERLGADTPARAAFWSATCMTRLADHWRCCPTRLRGQRVLRCLLPEPEQLARTLAEASAAGLGSACSPVARWRSCAPRTALRPAAAGAEGGGQRLGRGAAPAGVPSPAAAGRWPHPSRMPGDPRRLAPAVRPACCSRLRLTSGSSAMFMRGDHAGRDGHAAFALAPIASPACRLPLGAPAVHLRRQGACCTAGLRRPGLERFCSPSATTSASARRARAPGDGTCTTPGDPRRQTMFCRHSAASLRCSPPPWPQTGWHA